jgi:hypothetical protein
LIVLKGVTVFVTSAIAARKAPSSIVSVLLWMSTYSVCESVWPKPDFLKISSA